MSSPAKTLPAAPGTVIVVTTWDDDDLPEYERFVRLDDDPSGDERHWMSLNDGQKWPLFVESAWEIVSTPVPRW